MAIKRIIGRHNKKYKRCLKCERPINKVLRDDEVYTCEHCDQQHLIDVYQDIIVLTVAERPDIRRRPEEALTPQRRARRELIKKAEERKEAEAWEVKNRDWLEELATMPEYERKIELSLMGEEMLRRVKRYFDNRNEQQTKQSPNG